MNNKLVLSSYNYGEYYEQMENARQYGNIMIICFIIAAVLFIIGIKYVNKNKKDNNPYLGKIFIYLGLIALVYGFINILSIPIIAVIAYKIFKLTKQKEEQEIKDLANNINKQIQKNNKNNVEIKEQNNNIEKTINNNDKGEFIIHDNNKGEFIVNKDRNNKN